MGEEVNTERTKYGLMTVTHMHDCDQCVFIGASHSSRGKTTDWYVCGGSMPTVIGRHSSRGPDYWSMDVQTVKSNIKHPAYIVSDGTYAFSEMMLIAYSMYNLWENSR
jgi:hypothetical protein